MSLYRTNKDQWYTEYIEGNKPPPNQDMIRGLDIHAFVLEGGTKAIDPKIYWVSDIRVHERIKKEFGHIVKLENLQVEQKHEMKIDTVPFVGIWDGYGQEDGKNKILELKTGKKLWDENRVRTHGQLYCYAMQHFLLFGSIPSVLLVSASTLSGKVLSYELTPSEADISLTRALICETWKDMGDLQTKRIKPIVKYAGI